MLTIYNIFKKEHSKQLPFFKQSLQFQTIIPQTIFFCNIVSQLRFKIQFPNQKMNKSMKRDSRMQESSKSPRRQKLQWQQIKTPSTIIKRRSCHSSCIFKNKLYVYGGYDNNQPDILNDFFCFSFETNQWEEVRQKGELPGRRHSQSALLYNEKMYMFGGVYEFMTNTNQLHVFDFRTNNWSLVATKATPPSIDSHRCCLFQNQMVVGLGYSQNEYNPHIYSLNLDTLTWKKLFSAKNVPTQTYPQPRANGSFTVNNQHLFIYGGRNFYDTFSDLWAFDLVRLTFQKIQLFNEIQGRFGHSAVANDNKLYIFGGTRGVTHERNDLIVIDLQKKYVKTCWTDSQQERKKSKEQFNQILKKTRKDSASKKCQFKHCEEMNLSENQGQNYQSPGKYRTKLKEVSYYNELYDSRRTKADFKKKTPKSTLFSEINESSLKKESQKMSLNATFQILTNSIMLSQGKSPPKEQKSELNANDGWRHIPKARDNYSVDLLKNKQEIFMIVFGGGMHKIGFNDIIKIDLKAINHKYLRQ